MSLKNRLRVVVVCATLQLGVMLGAPMRPEQIAELMHQMNQPKDGARPANRGRGWRPTRAHELMPLPQL